MKIEYIEGDELPFRIDIDGNLKGAGTTPSLAIMAALSVGNKIPKGRRDCDAAIEHLTKHNEMSDNLHQMIIILRKNTLTWNDTMELNDKDIDRLLVWYNQYIDQKEPDDFDEDLADNLANEKFDRFPEETKKLINDVKNWFTFCPHCDCVHLKGSKILNEHAISFHVASM